MKCCCHCRKYKMENAEEQIHADDFCFCLPCPPITVSGRIISLCKDPFDGDEKLGAWCNKFLKLS